MAGSPADPLARDVRKYVFDHFLEHAVPPVLEQIMERYHLDRVKAFAVLKALEDARHLKLVPGTQRILMAFPFSAVATPFRVTRPVITLEETHALSVPIYKDKLRAEYVRPGKDELISHFRSLGLTGEFWRL